MVDKVEATQKKLFEMNIELEDLVEERTNNLLKEIEKREYQIEDADGSYKIKKL